MIPFAFLQPKPAVMDPSIMTRLDAVEAAVGTRIRGYDLGTVTISQTATVALVLGVRTFNLTGVTGLLATDLVMVVEDTGMPDGYGLCGAKVTGAGALKVRMLCPVLALGASFSFTVRVIALR